MADKCWIVYGLLGGLGCPGPRFNYYNGTKWVFDKVKYRAHLQAIADAGANAVRRIPSAGAWDAHPYGKKGQFCEFKYVSESVGWNLNQFNTTYFNIVGEAIQIENSLGLTDIQCFADNCVHGKNNPNRIYSPWVSNNNGVTDVYDSDGYTYFDALIDKYLSTFSGMDILWSPGNEMNNSAFPALFNTVIHPLVDAGTLNSDRLTYGATHEDLQITCRACLQVADRNKVIMEWHGGKGWTTDFNAKIATWEDTGARMLFSDDGKYDANRRRPSATEWYNVVKDILNGHGHNTDSYILNFEHCPADYDHLSTTFEAATIAKMRKAYDEWDTSPTVQYTISGYVKTAGAVGIDHVTISGLPNTPTTATSGLYSDTVDTGWSGTAVPKKGGYTFDPVSTVYTNVTSDKTAQNYTGTGAALPYKISGYVKTASGDPISGVSMGGFPTVPITDSDGYYYDHVASGWSGTITPTKTDFTFTPVSIVYASVTSDKINKNYVGIDNSTPSLVPVAPSDLTATISGATTATLAWKDNSINETDFHIEKSTTYPGASGFAEIATVAANVITYEATALTEGQAVWFRVRAHNSVGYSTYTDIVLLTSPSAVSTPRPAQRLANLPYPFGFKSLDEVRDYLIKLRSKLGGTDFSIRLGDVINNYGEAFNFPLDGILYEMLTCNEEVLEWGWPGIENTYIGLDAAYSMTTGSYNTLGGYGSGMYLTTEKGNTFYGARSGFLGGEPGTEETIEAASYDLKYTSIADHNPNPQPICSWDGMVVTLDCIGADLEDYKIVGSYDGITWTTLLTSATSAASGIWTEAGCMAAFKGSLWYSIYYEQTLGIVQQWDGATLTGHLKASYTEILQLYPWGDKLWAIESSSAYGVWVAGYTTGSSPGGVPATWVEISNYDGDAQYAWNSVYKPIQQYLQESVHLFGFGGSLYIACSKWNGTSSQWETKILKYDDASAFTTVATITPDEKYLHPCGIAELSGTVYLFLSECAASGSPAEGDGRLVVYTSTNMSAWTLWKDFGDGYGIVCDARYFNQRIFVITQSDYVGGANDTNVYYLVDASKSLTKEATLASTLGPAGDFIEFEGCLWLSQYLNIYRRTANTWIQTIYPDDTIGSYNSFFGLGAGLSNLTGRFNTCLGYLSDVVNSGLENATAIGYRALVSDDNTLVLGGTGAYAVNVAIGKTSASERLDVAGNIKASGQLIAGQATGTSPVRVVSTTVNTNFNADMLDGKHATDFLGLPILSDPGADRILFWDETDNLLKWLACGDSIAITTTTLDTIQDIRTISGPSWDHVHSTVATGTPPFVVASTTEVANLNADLLDGLHASEIIAGYASSNIASNPMTGEYRIKALRFDSSNNIVVVYDNVAEGAPAFYGNVVSNPQIGEYKINALRLDSSKNIVVGYDDTAMIAIPGHSAIYSNPNSGEYRIRALRFDSSMGIAVVYNATPEP